MTYRQPVVLDPRQARLLRRALHGTGLGFLGANSSEALQLEVGPESSRLAAAAQARYARGAILDAAVTPVGITSQEAAQLPDRIRAALRDCGHEVEEAKWGGGSGLESLRGKVYVRWRAHSRVNAVQHINEIAAILASVAPAFGPAARLTVDRMRVDRGPLTSNVYVYLEPSMGLPQVVCDAARRTPIPEQSARTFEPAPPAPGSAPEPSGKPGSPPSVFDAAAEMDLPGKPISVTAIPWILGGLGVAALLALGFGAVAYAAGRRRPLARNRRKKRRRRRRSR